MRANERIIHDLKRIANALECIAGAPKVNKVKQNGLVRIEKALSCVANALERIMGELKSTLIASGLVSDVQKLLAETCDLIECSLLFIDDDSISPHYYEPIAKEVEHRADILVHLADTHSSVADETRRLTRSLERMADSLEVHSASIKP